LKELQGNPNNAPYVDLITKNIFDDVTNLLDGAEVQLERMRMQLLSEGKILTDGGRVLAVTALGDTIEEARNKVYKNIEKIKFDKMEYRKDIAKL